MILTRARLAEIGEALYGAEWQDVLAEKLGKSKRTIQRYVADPNKARSVRNMPKELRGQIEALIEEQIALLGRYMRDQNRQQRAHPALTETK